MVHANQEWNGEAPPAAIGAFNALLMRYGIVLAAEDFPDLELERRR